MVSKIAKMKKSEKEIKLEKLTWCMIEASSRETSRLNEYTSCILTFVSFLERDGPKLRFALTSILSTCSPLSTPHAVVGGGSMGGSEFRAEYIMLSLLAENNSILVGFQGSISVLILMNVKVFFI